MEEFFSQFWNLVVTFINPLNLSHPERYVEALRTQGALWPSLFAVAAIVFTETGLLIGFLLPGDSMLVVVGIFIRAAEWPLALFMVVLCVAAVVGDTVGYWIGAKTGPKIFSRPDSRFFKQEYLQRAKAFYEKHGGKTIIIARFIPIIRTFVPVVAGAAKMRYGTFLFYNVVGGIGWIVSMLLLGFMLDPLLKQVIGPQFEIAKHIDKVILVVVLLSISPMIWKWWTHRRAGESPGEAAVETVAGIDPEDPASKPTEPAAATLFPASHPRGHAMPSDSLNTYLRSQLEDLKAKGLYKAERRIESPQRAEIDVNGRHVVNFCANNYLGLANHPDIVNAAFEGLKAWGYGLSSVRFICGTQDIHKRAERQIADFFRKADSILYISCFDANGGLFEPLLTEQDAILSDELNHASIIDGVRLCKAKRFRYKHNDMDDLKAKLEEAKGCRFLMIFTDSVFSMDGDLAKLPDICDLADRYNAAVGIDDCHATGHLGETGRGAAEELGVLDRVDVITGTLGKTLGGASGGFTAASAEVVDWLRNRSRPYLFSNSVPPALVAAGMKALDLVDSSAELRTKLKANTKKLRAGLEGAGFTVKPGPTPILPVMLGDASLATDMAAELLKRGIYVIGFSYPVVPQGQARIRIQVSAAHTDEQIDRAIAAFTEVGKQLGVVK